jgi:hypothetical protein
MAQPQTTRELLQACAILFGPHPQFSRDFLRYLQSAGLKSAYRQRALETHPDRLGLGGDIAAAPAADGFLQVQEAYEKLAAFVARRDGELSGTSSSECSAPTSPWRATPPSSAPMVMRPFSVPIIGEPDLKSGRAERFYRGPIPQRTLLFGNYLYYAGLTNWLTISRVLVWQRLGRPRLGELGIRLGILTENQRDIILRQRPPGRNFGTIATDLGYLTRLQAEGLVLRQARLQKKFGAILLEKGLVGDNQLNELLNRFKKHNSAG